MDNYEEYYHISELIVKYLKDALTEAEKDALRKWREADVRNEQLFQKLTSGRQVLGGRGAFSTPAKREEAFRKILAGTVGRKEKRNLAFIVKRYVGYAAGLLLFLGLGYFLLPAGQSGDNQAREVAGMLFPGGNKAVLVLDSGKEIDLDNAITGEIARQDQAVISKFADGSIAYNLTGGKVKGTHAGKVKYNTIVTPKGGQYRLRLPDGTQVWLNAASSLKFPTGFNLKERNVELTGEAFFDVAHLGGGTVPFKVAIGNQVIEVLGTEFNVNGYTDENEITTTLVSGTVKVGVKGPDTGSHEKKSDIMLLPGQKASLGRDAEDIRVSEADLEELTAWKNGRFQFHDTELEIIMRQIARWYDVEIAYEGNVKDIRFRGGISRDVPAENVFRILEASGINIKTEGRKIIVSN